MKRKKKNKNFLALFIIFVFSISIGFAFLNTMLVMVGTINVKGNTWDVYVDNVNIKSGSVSTTTPPINGDIESGITFVCSLMYPGDFYEFTVDIHNEGTVDAIIDSIDINPKLYDTQKGYINYTVEYQNGEQLAKNQLIKKGEFVRIKVRIEYRVDYTGSQTWFENIPGVIFINYVPDRGEGITVRDNGITEIVADGYLSDIGTIVTIGTENFYVIGSDGDNIKLLSMYNLYVGATYDGTNLTYYGNEATGMQDPRMLGYDGQYPFYGVTPFSTDSYHGSSVVSYEGSIVEDYVNNYKSLLESNFGANIVEARLITLNELTDSTTLMCDKTNETCSTSPYSWLYSTYYRTETTATTKTKYVVGYGGDFGWGSYDGGTSVGVRPVIVIPESDIVIRKIRPVSDGDINSIGTIVTIGTEKFYTIGVEGDNVKLISMYNLYVGYKCTGAADSTCTSYGTEATNMQNEKMKGYITTSSTRTGTSMFSYSSSNYSNSSVKNYIDSYVEILEYEYDVEILESRLISYDELADVNTFGCVENDKCSERYPWIYSTSYWTGTAKDSSVVYAVLSDGGFIIGDNYTSRVLFGVRPVIVISKNYFSNNI